RDGAHQRRFWTLSRAWADSGGGGSGFHAHERGVGDDAHEGHPAPHDQLWRQQSGKHAGQSRNADERKRACGMRRYETVGSPQRRRERRDKRRENQKEVLSVFSASSSTISASPR